MPEGSFPTAPEAPAPPRLWTVLEADTRIGDLAELLPQLREWARRRGEVRDELGRLVGFWGKDVDASDHPDHEHTLRLVAEERNLARRLDEAVGALHGEGIEVKDLATGLVDFYALLEGEVVYLCWRRGEPSVRFWHTLTGGFQGRRPISLGPGSVRSDVPPPH